MAFLSEKAVLDVPEMQPLRGRKDKVEADNSVVLATNKEILLGSQDLQRLN